ncbi:MAG TPA: helix-turn-helix domain-containing protein [Gaiellaceae bacterium]
MGDKEAAETLGQRVRRIRRERGLSQRDVAEPGISYAYLSRIEAGQRLPSVKALRIIARKLNVPLEYLETGEPLPALRGRDAKLTDAELALRLDPKPALVEKFRELLEEARVEADSVAMSRARIGLGLALAHFGEYGEAIFQLETALVSPGLTPLSHPDVYATLGHAYASRGRFDRSVGLFEGYLESLNTIAPDEHGLRVRFTSYLSCALADAGDFERSRTVLARLEAHEAKRLDDRGRATIYWSLARTDSMAGDSVTAIVHMERALAILEASEDRLEIARGHLTCAEILLLDERPQEAAYHLDRAEESFLDSADHTDYGVLRTHQARYALLEVDPDRAIELAQQALEYLKEHTTEQGSAWHTLGAAQLRKDDIDAAAKSMRRAIELLEKSGEWREVVTVARELAEAMRAAGRAEEAYELLERATVISITRLP